MHQIKVSFPFTFVCGALEPSAVALRLGDKPGLAHRSVRSVCAIRSLRAPDLKKKKNTVRGKRRRGWGGGIMKGVALRLSLPPFVERFVSLRRVSRLSNLALLIFCDTHADTLS